MLAGHDILSSAGLGHPSSDAALGHLGVSAEGWGARETCPLWKSLGI